MDHFQKNVESFMVKAGQTVRKNPTTDIPEEERILRVKLLLEEVLELADASGVVVKFDNGGDPDANMVYSTNDLDFQTPQNHKVDLVEVADALADIDYVNNGAATSYGLDLEPFKEEVHDSNMSKFIDGHRAEDGKWIKGPSYRPANIKGILSILKQKADREKDQMVFDFGDGNGNGSVPETSETESA